MSYDISDSNDSHFDRYEMVPTDTFDYQLLSDLPLSPPHDSSSSDHSLQALLNSNQSQQNPVDESICSDQLISSLLHSSLPLTDQLENLSLYQATQFPSFSFGPNLENGYENFSSWNFPEVKNEECRADIHSACSEAKYLQRSFSSNCFEGKPNFPFQPPFDSVLESQNFEGQAFSLPENSFFAAQMRKVCSTGDLENMRNVHGNQRSISTPSAIENSSTEEAPFKVGRYNPEERQDRISKYRAKRTQRNFNKTIKYACRKTLADNRPRIRGRFTRNDESVEIPKAAECSTRDEYEDELLALQEVEDEIMAMGSFINSFNQQHQFQYHHGCF